MRATSERIRQLMARQVELAADMGTPSTDAQVESATGALTTARHHAVEALESLRQSLDRAAAAHDRAAEVHKQAASRGAGNAAEHHVAAAAHRVAAEADRRRATELDGPAGSTQTRP